MFSVCKAVADVIASQPAASAGRAMQFLFLTFGIVPLSQRVDGYLFVILITMNEHLGSINPLATTSCGYTHCIVLEATHCLSVSISLLK